MANEHNEANVNQHIQRETQRQVGAAVVEKNREIERLLSIIKEMNGSLVKQHEAISRLTSEPLQFGTLLKVHSTPDARLFKKGEEVLVVDRESPRYGEGGKIIGNGDGPVIDANGKTYVKMEDGADEQFSIGINGLPQQIRMTTKTDGTHAVVSVDGKPWEVRGVPDDTLAVGEPVKLTEKGRQIVSRGYNLLSGPICMVVRTHENGVEIMEKGEIKLVQNPHRIELKDGDRVVVDKGFFLIQSKLPRQQGERFKVQANLNLTWDDIGGLEAAKQELKEALELPFQNPDLFKYYNVPQERGILLYGPPGNGKTLLARVCASVIAKMHNKESVESGYIFVKAPEILDKWIGNSEATIRELFRRGRTHYQEHGYKAILAIDEADAIMPQRGTRVSSSITDTLVPMFLGEMDGVDEKQTQENPIVILMTNRADMLDPAVVRPGRINKHIKIDRPDQLMAIKILQIHTKDTPFQDEGNKMSTLAVAAADIFSKSRLLYRVNGEHDFCLGDAVSGAVLENLAQKAKMLALHRDLRDNTRTGVLLEDFRAGVSQIFNQQRGLNHVYDLTDFAEKKGIQPQDMRIERCYGAA